MRHVLVAFGSAVLASGMLASAQPASAADDTWVSATGADAGDCPIAAPCRTLRYALAQTTAGGTIIILASGRYGPVHIAKSVHIIAEGVAAEITRAGNCGAAICVEAGSNDVISLRGLTISLSDSQKDAIRFSSGGALDVDRCTVEGNLRYGVLFSPSTSAKLYVADSRFSVGTAAAQIGSTGGVQHVLFNKVSSHNSLHGIGVGGFGSTGSIVATVRDSAIGSFWGSGIGVYTDGGAVAIELMIDRTVIANGAYGVDIVSGQNANVRMGDSTLSGHQIGGVNGAVASYGTNKVVQSVDGIAIPNVIPMK